MAIWTLEDATRKVDEEKNLILQIRVIELWFISASTISKLYISEFYFIVHFISFSSPLIHLKNIDPIPGVDYGQSQK